MGVTNLGSIPIQTASSSGFMDGFLGLLGGLGAGLFSYGGSKSANRTNLKIAREQMEFQRAMVAQQMQYQTEMSNTSYQRAMADMEAAGLNPILAARVGGAGTPSGSSAGGAGATMTNEIGPAVSSAIDMARSVAELKSLKQALVIAKENERSIGVERKGSEIDNEFKQESLEQLRLLRPALENAKKFAEDTGQMMPYVNSLNSMLDVYNKAKGPEQKSVTHNHYRR